MKHLVFSITVFFIHAFCFAQVDRKQIADSITREGKRLYESEMASWYGTDVFLDKFKEESDNIGGYFSYKDGEAYKCVFYTKDEKPTVLGTITFKGSYDPAKALPDGTKRAFTAKEMEYYMIRKASREAIKTDTSFFKSYKNTSVNLVPLIDDSSKKVYVLTATNQTGFILIGNDYLLTFDKSNNLVSKQKIHANLITMKTKEEEETGDGKIVGSVHNHIPETGDFITATDICTFMLYKDFSNWKQQVVYSKKYMSIWDCESGNLVIISTGR